MRRCNSLTLSLRLLLSTRLYKIIITELQAKASGQWRVSCLRQVWSKSYTANNTAKGTNVLGMERYRKGFIMYQSYLSWSEAKDDELFIPGGVVACSAESRPVGATRSVDVHLLWRSAFREASQHVQHSTLDHVQVAGKRRRVAARGLRGRAEEGVDHVDVSACLHDEADACDTAGPAGEMQRRATG
jgi:hypothetical protein